jgi:hypothetical protein
LISDDISIDRIFLLFVGVAPFKVSDELWVELIIGGLKGSHSLAGGQEIDQVEIGGRRLPLWLSSGLKSPFVLGLLEASSPGPLQRRGYWRRSEIRFSLWGHKADGIELGADVTADKKGF